MKLTLQEKFQKHLSWFYGDKAKLKESIEASLVKYRQIPVKSEFINARIKQYERLAAMCCEQEGKQLTLFDKQEAL